MSRIGKMPVVLPPGVTVTVGAGTITVSGGKGTLTRVLPEGVRIEVAGDTAVVSVEGDGNRNLFGLYRTLLANMVKGVTDGFTKTLDIVGVGYKAESKEGRLTLSLGYSHPVVFPLPPGVTADVEGTTAIKVSGTDKEIVGQTAAKIRSLRPPDVYKQKGIRYRGERLLKKAGKAAGR
jgi:large subunit ribosomal protein L6